MTLTGSEAKRFPTEEYQTACARQMLMRRPGEPDDIGAAMAFLALDDANHIDGQVIFVDGGYSVGMLSVSG